MKKTTRFQSLVTKVLAPALALFIFSQCMDEPKVEEAEVAAAEIETVSNNQEDFSLTIDGIHTVIANIEDCKTCNYVVPEDASVVDGKELGIKPGQAICLDSNFKYGSLKLINLEGEADRPIVVAYSIQNRAALSEN